MFSFLKKKSYVPDYVLPKIQTSQEILQTPKYTVEDKGTGEVVVTQRHTKTAIRLNQTVLTNHRIATALLVEACWKTAADADASSALIIRSEEHLALDWASAMIVRGQVLNEIQVSTLGILVDRTFSQKGTIVSGISYDYIMSFDKKFIPDVLGYLFFVNKHGRSLTYKVTPSYFFDGKTVVGFDFTLEK